MTGNRQQKHLNEKQREALIAAAYAAPPHHRSLLWVLLYTGCKVSEALRLMADHIDFSGQAIMIAEDSRKCRCIPVPSPILAEIDAIHGITALRQRPEVAPSSYLWPVNRTTAWRWVAAILRQAGIPPALATPRVLRHSFTVKALRDGTPLATLQYWMGYTTTEMQKFNGFPRPPLSKI